ncbi:MAG TPA: sensor histidine kinase [Streptosporangiaceae bacterium]|nr:sensor histidine kinase [Streptosporangiaceae bacterium]
MSGTAQRQRAAATTAWAVTVVLAAVAGLLTILAWNDLVTGDAISVACGVASAVLYSSLGALIVRRAGNVIGWYLLVAGIACAVVQLNSMYAVLGIKHPGSLPDPAIAGVLAEWSFTPLICGIALMCLVFPTGHLPSPRWRPAGSLCVVIVALTLIGFLVQPRTVQLPAPGGVSAAVQNPLGLHSLPEPLAAVLIGNLNQAWFVLIALLLVATAAMVVRYRSGVPELRQQIKWLAFTAAALVGCSLVVLASQDLGGQPWSLLTTISDEVVTAIGLVGFPVAIAIAILKYGLYQIDVIISKALTYGLLSAALTAVYVGIVVGIGTLAGYAGGPALTVAAAVVVAVLFHPVRQRASRLANRFVYGRRASPYQVLADFAQDMAGQLDADAALDRMAAVLGGATGAERVEVWVLVGDRLLPRSVWPSDAAHGAAPLAVTRSAGLAVLGPVCRAIGVYHRDEPLGAITLAKARNEPVSAAEDNLLTDLASQAGLVLRNVRLTAELRATIDDLRASRRRLVQAQDDERQRIERNLHDGAQQQLVALSVHLGLLDGAADDPEEVRELAAELRSGLRAAMDDLRALARGIYPPVLADQGLRAALQAQADRAPMPVVIDADGIGRFSREAETALYFCILEALQNAAKYAGASLTTVTVREVDGMLDFSIADDGVGFDLAAAAGGSGLQGMADRLSAAGGELHVTSAPGKGTAISGTVPVTALVPAMIG